MTSEKERPDSPNGSGYRPYDIGVLVRVKEPQEKATKGGIILSSSMEAVSIEASQVGTIVAMGKCAYEGAADDAPQIGDEVYFVRYAGQMIYPWQSEDEKHYRAMDFHDIRLIRRRHNDDSRAA